MSGIAAQRVQGLLKIKLAAYLLISGGFFLFSLSLLKTLSFFLGIMVFFIPCWVFFFVVFKTFEDTREPNALKKQFYIGECVKILVSFLLFGMYFKFITFFPFVFMMGYIGALVISQLVSFYESYLVWDVYGYRNN